MKHYKKYIGKSIALGLLLQAITPIALFAEQGARTPARRSLDAGGCCKKIVNAHRVNTNTLCVRNNAKFRGDVTIEGDLTVKGQIDGDCQFNGECADFIVIGMGAAGACIAKRLTDDHRFSVIGFEAGDNNNNDPVIEDLNFTFALATNFIPYYFWQGEALPMPQNFNKILDWTNGRLLGGGTSINGGQFVRGSREYFEKIEAILGSDWSVDKVFARYKAMETYTGPLGPGPNTRGDNGPIDNVALVLEGTDDTDYLIGAMEVIGGFEEIVDYNNPETPIGPFLRWDDTVQPDNNFVRESSATAFLGSDVMTPEGIGVDGRKLRVHTNATIQSFIWHKNKVIGVNYVQDGECFQAFAKKEVIVCAGFQSAQMLQREGVGPIEVLSEAGVPVRVANAHVGRHLTNHPVVQAVFVAPGVNFSNPGEPITVYGPGAFLPTDPNDPNPERNFQWIAVPFPDTLVLFAILVNPIKSEGTISIQNRDPFKIPLVDLNYLNDTDGPGGTSEDLDNFVQALRNFVLGLDDYFDENLAPNGQKWILVSPSREVIEDDILVREFIRANIFQAHHWSSAVRMGPDAQTAVLDARTRVFGVEGLRVADASSLPFTSDGNLQAPAYLVGWSVADFLLEEYT